MCQGLSLTSDVSQTSSSAMPLIGYLFHGLSPLAYYHDSYYFQGYLYRALVKPFTLSDISVSEYGIAQFNDPVLYTLSGSERDFCHTHRVGILKDPVTTVQWLPGLSVSVLTS